MGHWWQDRTVYQIYPRSFHDGNHDGMGDLLGIIEKLDYLNDLGIGIIWISPVYKSPQKDNGYDISDYYDIDPLFGTMADMDRLLIEAKKRDIKIVMDLVMNHTSNQHEWFQKSRQRIEPYTDYYIWKDGVNGGYPNNWTSFFSESAWTYDSVRGQYYLHLFAQEQIDLNFSNPHVIEEIKKIMRFWLDRGVDGFRYDAISMIYKSTFDNGSATSGVIGQEHFIAQEGNHKILRELTEDVMEKYDSYSVGEAGFIDAEMALEFCNPDRHELNMIFTFSHMETNWIDGKWIKGPFQPRAFFNELALWQKQLPWSALFLENHDQIRCVGQLGNQTEYWRESATLLATLLLSLKGTPYIYQGQEIGMVDAEFTTMDDIVDVEAINQYKLYLQQGMEEAQASAYVRKASRDNVRTPMQWDDTKNAGFSTVPPWIRVPVSNRHINVENQLHDETSILSYYKKLIHLRNNDTTLQYGSFNVMEITDHVFVYERSHKDTTYTILLNMSKHPQNVSYLGTPFINNYPEPFQGVLQPYQAIILK